MLDAATAGLESLDLSNGLPDHEASDMLASPNRWCRDGSIPDYEPLNIPPLGGTNDQPHDSMAIGSESRKSDPPSPQQGKRPVSQAITWAQGTSQRSRKKQSKGPPSTAKALEVSLPQGTALQSPAQRTAAQPRKSRSKTRKVPSQSVKDPPTPIPAATYLQQAAIPAHKLSYPQPLLLVLDLNGTLLWRPRGSQVYTPRPSLAAFLAHCITNYSVLIWSSATLVNVSGLCSKIFTPEQRQCLLGEWARDTLDLNTKQFNAKVQVYKRLNRVWQDEAIQKAHPRSITGGRWGQDNTLLLDDSRLKASAEPHNAVVLPEFVKDGGEVDGSGDEVLAQVVAYLEMARRVDNVSSFVQKRPFRIDAGWKWDWATGTPAMVDLSSDDEDDAGGVMV
ncbi:MAG: hypothetical protein Q9183_000105 [Haloplaca sp. 2 TL-2023]